MNNLPITTNTTQAASKPAQATAMLAAAPAKSATVTPAKNAVAAAAQAAPAKPATAAATQNAAEDGATQGQSFNEVLARQVSDANDDATPTPTAKKTSTKSAEEIFADIKAVDTSTPVTPVDATNLPTDMLAALIPQGMNIASKTNASGDASDLLEQPSKAATTPEMTALPTQVTAGTSALSKPTTPATEQISLDTPATNGAGKALPGAAREPQIEAKKDTAAFAGMMATMNSNMADKLSNTDEKAAALATAPQSNAAALASVQASATSLSPAIVMPTVVTINTPVTHDKWGDEFNQKITWLANAKEQSAELHLNPPQLGPMDVVLKVNGDQATALFTSPHAAVRDAIEQAMPKLREMLADSGIMLGNATVSDHSRNQQNDSGNKSSGSRSGIGSIADSGAAISSSVRVSPISRHNGIVDTFA